MNNNHALLEQLVEAVEQTGANLAPTYQEYMPLAFAVANSCGETGRTLFHRLCRMSEKYKHEEADKLYDHALKKGTGANSLGTVFHLAEAAGVDVKKLSFTPLPSSHTHANYNAPDEVTDEKKEITSDETSHEGPLPPPFPEYEWPHFLQQAVECGETKAQRDILLLGTITILGATLNRMVRFNYGHKEHYPCLQTFILAHPASGKGALSWARQLAEPIHARMLSTHLEKMKTYRTEKCQWDCMGKERVNHPEPEQPRMKLFFIAGDNSSTGIQENLMDNDGVGLICESEADTVSTAIGTDYGHWSHTLRKAFDHDRLSYNRRTNHEYRECAQLQLSVLLSGTPAQLRPLIPSAENGLFSRQLFYYMPDIQQWVDQFSASETDYSELFRSRGERWKTVLDAVKAETGGFRFQLSPLQQERFNLCMARLFTYAGTVHGHTMRSTVARIAINLCRMMCVVALLRSLEKLIDSDESTSADSIKQQLSVCPGLAPDPRTPAENIADGMIPSYLLSIDPTDFDAVLDLAEPLYRHASRALLLLPDADTTLRQASPREVFLSALPMQFTRKEAMETARQNGISENTFDTLIKRMSEKGVIESTGRGQYQFSSRMCVKGAKA